MKHLSGFLSFCCLLLSCTAFAQKAQVSQRSLLWKISKKDQKQASYLMGTIHMICADDYFWTPAMQKSFEATDRLCLEMDLSDPELLTRAGAMMVDFSGTTLKDYFSDSREYELVKHYIQDSMGQSIEIAERMKPVALYMMYTMGLIKGPSCKETVSYELKMAELAKEKSHAISGLETLEDQMTALESIPTDSIIREMVRIAEGKKNESSEMEELINAYKKQDLEALNRITAKTTIASGMDSKLLIDNRNKNWIAPMSKMMLEKPTFFAVGAGHVYGLLQLLKQAGYTVEPVK